MSRDTNKEIEQLDKLLDDYRDAVNKDRGVYPIHQKIIELFNEIKLLERKRTLEEVLRVNDSTNILSGNHIYPELVRREIIEDMLSKLKYKDNGKE
jgi:hypothetical protein